jgi:hypothetical protein
VHKDIRTTHPKSNNQQGVLYMRFFSLLIAAAGIFIIYKNRFRILSFLISFSFIRRFMAMAAVNLPDFLSKVWKENFIRSA